MPREDAASFRLVRRAWTLRLKNSAGPAVVALAKKLVPLGVWERICAYEIIVNHEAALNALSRKDVVSLGQGMKSWGETDCFACYVAGPAWRLERISDGTIRSWAQSTNRWWRRAALVSTVPLNNRARGGQGDAPRTLKLCRLLIDDCDDMVVKALSWALRELGKRDAPAVRAFLERYEKHLAPRVKREVTNKLESGLKNPPRSLAQANRKIVQ